MGDMCKEFLCDCILDCLDSDESLAGHEEPQICDGYINIPFFVGNLLTESGIIDFKGMIVVFDTGYYIVSSLGFIAAKSAVPELIRFIERLNSCTSYGNVEIDLERGMVFYKTYQRFWDEHGFNPEIFYNEITTHIDAHMDYKESINLLIKGASSAASQIEKLRTRKLI
jgi:hypothetical protein